MTPGAGAVIFLTIALIVVFAGGFFLVHRVMTTPGAHIGSRLPKDDPDRAVDGGHPDRAVDGRHPDRNPDGDGKGRSDHLGDGKGG